MLNTVDRTGKVLNLFTADRPEWGVREASAALRLPTSTTHDILSSLTAIGLLQQTSADRYRLGWRILEISRRLMRSMSFSPFTHHHVTRLAQSTASLVTIGAWDGQGVIIVDSASAGERAFPTRDDLLLPGHTSALGKRLMAMLPVPRVIGHASRHGLPSCTARSITDIAVLTDELASVRSDDLATDRGETIEGQWCIAVGIRCPDGQVVAALSISMPEQRMRARFQECVHLARRTAQTIARAEATS